MKINVFCENSFSGLQIFSAEEVTVFAEKLLFSAINELSLDDYSPNYSYTFEVLLCDNEFIHHINKEYRNIDKPTDVITFALYADSPNKLSIDNVINLGQIVISVEKCIEQADENNNSKENEFLTLLAHGVLHLIGIDHPDEDELEKMLKLQNKMIESIDYVKI